MFIHKCNNNMLQYILIIQKVLFLFAKINNNKIFFYIE